MTCRRESNAILDKLVLVMMEVGREGLEGQDAQRVMQSAAPVSPSQSWHQLRARFFALRPRNPCAWEIRTVHAARVHGTFILMAFLFDEAMHATVPWLPLLIPGSVAGHEGPEDLKSGSTESFQRQGSG